MNHGSKQSDCQVTLEPKESGIYIIRLGAQTESVVTLSVSRMESLAEAIKQVQKSRPTGLVITGSGEEMFCAGADVNLIRDVTDKATATKLAKMGQDIFGMIEALPFPTIAAISGPCVGGGCELALACKYRIITDNRNSAIGLPEIKLGILPGFGGTQRLPRLVGLPKALDVILAGKILKPSQALKCGLVNEIVSYNTLLTRAENIVTGAAKLKEFKLKFADRFLTNTKIGRNIVYKQAKAKVQSETKGFYPAPPAALDSCIYGLTHGMKSGLENEAQELGRLIVTPESKSLVRIFFLTEVSKSIGKGAKRAIDQLHTIVVGAGVMGAGIAGSLARSECQVILKDSSDQALNRGIEHIKKYLSKLSYLSEQERSFILNRIEPTTKESPNLGNAHLAIEAVFEDLNVKRKILGDLARAMPNEAILATNTSSLPVTQIAADISAPDRVVGMHFFNPVEKMPLVEIVRGELTSDKTVVVIAALTSKLGKYPIVVKDVPGFLVNRTLVPYLTEAAYCLSDGYTIEDIDKAATRFGMPMGPIRLLDEVGLDVAAHVAEIMVKGYGNRMKGPDYSAKLVAAGRKGKKSGAGFYDFGEEQKPHNNIRALLDIKTEQQSSVNLEQLQERLILPLINEAVRCLDEGVAGKPSPDAASQVDLGSVMGFGFPPFRGGVLWYAQSIGAKVIYDKLSALEKKYGERFSPATGIKARAEKNKTFLDKL